MFQTITVLLELATLPEAYSKFSRFEMFLENLNYTTYYLDPFFEAELKQYMKNKFRDDGIKLKAMDLSVMLVALSEEADLVTFDKKLEREWERITDKVCILLFRFFLLLFLSRSFNINRN